MIEFFESKENSLRERVISSFEGKKNLHIKRATITPDKTVAGKYASFEICFKLGEKGLSSGMFVVIDFPGILATTRPQTHFQEEPGYTTFDFPENVQCETALYSYADRRCKTMDDEDSIRFRRECRTLIIAVEKERMKEGDKFVVRFGDNSDGMGPGAMMGIVVPNHKYEYPFHYKVFQNSELTKAVDGGSFGVHVGPDKMKRCVRIVRKVGKEKKTLLQCEDQFRNVVSKPESVLEKLKDDKFSSNRYGIISVAGDKKISSKLFGVVNCPETDLAFQNKNIYFGDTHIHTEFSYDVKYRHGRTMVPSEMFDFARHSSLLDFCVITDHHQPWNKNFRSLTPEEWAHTAEAAKKADASGKFAAFMGIEFTGKRGDTVVLFGEDIKYDELQKNKKDSMEDVWRILKNRKAISIPHFHSPGGMPEGDWLYDEKFERLIEMHSCHGNFFEDNVDFRVPPSCKNRRSDRNAKYLLQRGLRYGLIGSGDDHKGHCGRPALCGVVAENLAKDSIFDALYNRHVYATSGDRIKLIFSGNGELMGSELKCGKVEFCIEAEGCDAIRRVDFLKNGEVENSFYPGNKKFNATFSRKISQNSFYQVIVAQENTHCAWSSPIWVDVD